MSHTSRNKPRDMDQQAQRRGGNASWVGICDKHGKRCYLNKKEAKKAKRQHPRGHELSVYPCENWWHLGHLPKAIINGSASRDTIRSKKT